MADDDFQYESGFGNEFVTEAVNGALPVGRNSPQQAPLGLYAQGGGRGGGQLGSMATVLIPLANLSIYWHLPFLIVVSTN